MASGGMGTVGHLSGELFKMMTGVNLVHVPYRGLAPALTDLLGGQVQVTFASMASSIEYIRTGKLRALAVTTATRSEMLPDVPTVGESVPGYEASTWSGVGAPKATPAEIVEKLNKEINAALADHKIKARLADLGSTPLVGSATDLGRLIADETEKWGNPDGEHQGELTRQVPIKYSVTPVKRSRGPPIRVANLLGRVHVHPWRPITSGTRQLRRCSCDRGNHSEAEGHRRRNNRAGCQH
jgi:Tripartite tricarboxylate transporter family receptor